MVIAKVMPKLRIIIGFYRKRPALRPLATKYQNYVF